MKKKLLVAEVMAAMTLSAVSVFAAPTFSGDANIEWNHHTNGGAGNYLTNRIRLHAAADIDDVFSIHGRARMDNDLRNGTPDKANTMFDQAYIGAKLVKVDLKLGRQSLFSGKGLLMDDDNFSGLQAAAALEGVNVNGFYGKNSSGDKTSLGEIKTSNNGINMGANYLNLDGTHYWGVNADTKFANNAEVNIEYVKNAANSATGYLAGVTMGNYSVSYRDIKNGAVDTHTTNSNYNDSKGFKLSAHYAISKNSSVTLYQDLATDHNNTDKHRTNMELEMNF